VGVDGAYVVGVVYGVPAFVPSSVRHCTDRGRIWEVGNGGIHFVYEWAGVGCLDEGE